MNIERYYLSHLLLYTFLLLHLMGSSYCPVLILLSVQLFVLYNYPFLLVLSSLLFLYMFLYSHSPIDSPDN